MTTPVTREVVRIPFRDGEVLTVEIGGRPHVVLRPALETIGLDYSAQWRKIQGRSWATVVHATTVAADGSIREMATVDVRTFLMLLATINESHVSDAVRPTLVAYQNEVADAIEAYWTRGVAVNPRSTAIAPRLLSLEEAAAVLRQEYRLDYTVVDLTRAMRAAGITRLSGGPKKDAFGLLWFNGSAWMVVAEFIGELAKMLGRTEEKVGAQLERGFQMQLDLTPARELLEVAS
jgi:hypothetical protein